MTLYLTMIIILAIISLVYSILTKNRPIKIASFALFGIGLALVILLGFAIGNM